MDEKAEVYLLVPAPSVGKRGNPGPDLPDLKLKFLTNALSVQSPKNLERFQKSDEIFKSSSLL